MKHEQTAAMKTATVNLGRILTRVEYNGRFGRVTTHKMGEFDAITAGYDVVELTGESTSGKFDKYENRLLAAGYEMTTIVCPKPVVGHSFIRIIYTKTK
jgi:hypothetical protein